MMADCVILNQTLSVLSLASSLSQFLFEPSSLSSYLGHDQCETNGRGDASVVLKKKMTKGCWKGQPWTLRERN
jgi:hypothetical protein